MTKESNLKKNLQEAVSIIPAESSFSEFLTEAEANAEKLGRPQMPIEFEDGLILFQLVKVKRPKRILEIGVLSGYSSLWMIKAMEPQAEYLGLELDASCVELAKPLLSRFADSLDRYLNIEFRIGPALETLSEDIGLFDLVFIDADKANYLNYFEKAWEKLQPKGLVIVDNAFLYGEVFSGEAEKFSNRQIQVMKELHIKALHLGGSFIHTSDGFLCVSKD